MTTSPSDLPAGGPPVLVETSPELPLVTVTVALRTGAAQDPPRLAGRTRMLGRLMRRTGGGLPPHELDARIDSLGASVGVDVGHSSLSFHATVITRSLDPLLDLMADMLSAPELAGEELERLRRETHSELVDTLDHDRALVQRWFRREVFGAHPYALSTVGTVATIKHLATADLRAAHEATVVTNNLVFAFAGDIDHRRAAAAARRLQQDLPARPAPRPELGDPEPPRGRHLLLVDKPERTQTQILIGTLGTRADDVDHTALQVANTVFGGTFSARLTREIRAERGWSYGAYSSLPVDRFRQAFSMWTFPKATDAAPCVRHQLHMLEQWHAEGISAAELEWAQSYLVKSHAFAVDTASKRASLALEEELYPLPAGYYEDYIGRVQSVTLEEANAAIRQRIDPSALRVVVVGTAKTIQGDLERAIPRLDACNTVPFDAE